MLANWIPLIVTLAIQAMVAMALLTLPVMAAEVANALNISASFAGIYVAIVYLGAMLASLMAGAGVKRFGAIRISQLGLLMCAIGLGLCMLPSLLSIAFGAFFIGIGYGPITPASSHLLAKTTESHRISLVFSVKQTGVPLGGVLAGAIVPTLVISCGWQMALALVAVCNILCLLIAQPLIKSFDSDRDSNHSLKIGSLVQPIKMVFQYPALRLMAVCSFMFSMVQLSLTTYLVTYLYTEFSYSLVTAGIVLSIAQFGGMTGRITWGWVADRWFGARATLGGLAILMSFSALATASMNMHSSMILVVAVLVVFGATAIGWNGVYLAEVARQAPEGLASVATGGTLAITFLGVVLGPPLFGAIFEISGSYRLGFVLLAVLTALCAWAIFRRKTNFSFGKKT